jgi:ABC-type bacteriocin/lantibiotic exporter with double-glycine peptidase domain
MTSPPPFFAQARADTCMLACLRMILAHQGTEAAEAVLSEQVSLAEGGLDPDALAGLAQRYGLQAEARRLDLEAVARLVELGQFPIVLVDRSLLDREFTIHAVIPVRFTHHFVTVLDPLRGRRRISLRKFEKAAQRVGGWAVVWQEKPVEKA